MLFLKYPDVQTTQVDAEEDADGEEVLNGYIYKTLNNDLKQNVVSYIFIRCLLIIIYCLFLTLLH